MAKLLLAFFAACLVAFLAALASLTLFLRGEGLRERVEATLARRTGRAVHLQRLSLSLTTGTAAANGLQIADDPRFGTAPFLDAAGVRLGLALWPLLLRREVRIDTVALVHPSIRLVRNPDGTWNYASLATGPQRPATPPKQRHLPALAIHTITVQDGELLVRTASADGWQDRTFPHIDVRATGLQTGSAFPFTLAAGLPANGQLTATGTAGPFHTGVISVTAHVTAAHLDPAAAGLVGRSPRLSGVLNTAGLDLQWDGTNLHLDNLRLDAAHLTLLPPATPASPDSSASAWTTVLHHLQIGPATIHAAALTVAHTTLTNLDLHIDGWSPQQSALHAAARCALATGTLAADAAVTNAAQPLWTATIAARHIDFVSTGLLAPTSALRGTVDTDAHLQFGSAALSAEGTARIDRLLLAHHGEAAPHPVQANFRFHQSGNAGTIDRADLTFAAAVVHVAGTYRTGPDPGLHLHIAANTLPIDTAEFFLPAAGIQLPEGSRLQGGTLTTALDLNGSPGNLTLDGPVALDDTRLNGYDLAGKLASLARFTGGRLGSTTASPGTAIRSLRLTLHSEPGSIQTSNLAADIAGVGRITGDGTIGDGATLHYALRLRLEELTAGVGGGANLARGIASGLPGNWAAKAMGIIDALSSGPMKNGIPLLVGGTARHPTITPNLGVLFAPDITPRPPQPSPWKTPESTWPGTQKVR